MSEIKPCPFCGERPEAFTERGAPRHINGWSQIRCVNKDCLMTVYIHRRLPLAQLITIWNTRTL
jgi:hypothetical protein